MLWVLGSEKWSLDRLDSLNEPLTPSILGLRGLICQAQISKGLSPLQWLMAWRDGGSGQARGGRPRVVKGLVEQPYHTTGLHAPSNFLSPSAENLGTEHVVSV